MPEGFLITSFKTCKICDVYFTFSNSGFVSMQSLRQRSKKSLWFSRTPSIFVTCKGNKTLTCPKPDSLSLYLPDPPSKSKSFISTQTNYSKQARSQWLRVSNFHVRHGVFNDQFIFRTIFERIIFFKCHKPVSKLQRLVFLPFNEGLFSFLISHALNALIDGAGPPSRGKNCSTMYLKINQYVKTPWHRSSMGVALSDFWVPDKLKLKKKFVREKWHLRGGSYYSILGDKVADLTVFRLFSIKCQLGSRTSNIM